MWERTPATPVYRHQLPFLCRVSRPKSEISAKYRSVSTPRVVWGPSWVRCVCVVSRTCLVTRQGAENSGNGAAIGFCDEVGTATFLGLSSLQESYSAWTSFLLWVLLKRKLTNWMYAGIISVMPRLHQDTCCRIQVVSTCNSLVAGNMFLVSATKLSPVCRPSVAGYKEIQVWIRQTYTIEQLTMSHKVKFYRHLFYNCNAFLCYVFLIILLQSIRNDDV